MKTKYLLTGMLLLALTLCMSSAKADTVVVGQNDLEVDVAEVQAAVDLGGEVLLQGTFNFGVDGSVTINADVEIMGEEPSKIKRNPGTHAISGGNWSTTILGGKNTFFCENPDVNVKICKLHFDGPSCAIRIKRAKEVEISYNFIENCLEKETLIPERPGKVFYDCVAISLGLVRGDLLNFDYCFDYIKVSNNYIDMGHYVDGELVPREPVYYAKEDVAHSSRAITIYLADFIRVNMEKNTCKNTNRIALDMVNNSRNPVIPAGDVYIEKNVIELSPYASTGAVGDSKESFLIHCLGGYLGGIGQNTRYIITGNKFKAGTIMESATSIGIFLGGSIHDSIIDKNIFECGERTSIAVFCKSFGSVPRGHYNLIRNNRFNGSLAPLFGEEYEYGGAIYLCNFDSNVILGNNFNDLIYSPGTFTVGFHYSKENILVGGSGIVWDYYGFGNIVKGDYTIKTKRGAGPIEELRGRL